MMKYEMSSYFEDPEFKKSLATYEGMVNSHTPCYFDADELVDIADYYAFKGKHAEAENVIDYALHLHPDNTDILIFHSRSLALKGKLKEAYQVADLINDPTDREVIFLRADLLMEENKLEEADTLLTQLAEAEDYSPEVITDILLDYLDIEQKELADKWFHELSTRYSLSELTAQNRHILNVVTSYYSHFNDYEKAIPLLQEILDDSPYSIEHWCELGRCHIQLGNFSEAQEAIDFALAIDENDYEAIALKALSMLQLGFSEKACTYYKKLVDFPEKRVLARLSLSTIYQSNKNFEASLEQLKALFEIENELSSMEKTELYSSYALCCAALGKEEEGKRFLKKSLDSSEFKIGILMDYVRFYLNLYQQSQAEEEKVYYLQQAENFCQQGLQCCIIPEDRLFCLMNIASSYFDIQKFAPACEYLERISQEFPNQARTSYFYLIYGYFYLENTYKIMHYLAKIRKELPELYHTLGTTEDTVLRDTSFMGLMQALKENIENGNIDLDKYL